MAIKTDPTTDVGKVRMLTGDKYEEALFHSDEEIQAYLEMYDYEVKRAAAAALDSMANMEAIITKKIETLDLQTDGPSVAKELRKHAQELRRQVEEEPAFAVAEQISTNAQFEEFIWKEALRND